MIYVFFSWSFLGAAAHIVLTELDDQKLFSRGMASIKVIRCDPLAPVKTMVLLLPMEWKMPHFINNIE